MPDTVRANFMFGAAKAHKNKFRTREKQKKSNFAVVSNKQREESPLLVTWNLSGSCGRDQRFFCGISLLPKNVFIGGGEIMTFRICLAFVFEVVLVHSESENWKRGVRMSTNRPQSVFAFIRSSYLPFRQEIDSRALAVYLRLAINFPLPVFFSTKQWNLIFFA